MRKMFVVKVAFVLIGMVILYGYNDRNVVADEGCVTDLNCMRSQSTNACYCTDTGCDGCFIPTNDHTCGKCTKKPGELE